MITNLSMENFKGFASKAEIELSPISLIYGENSSGKSSIFQSLLLLHQSLLRSIQSTPSHELLFAGPLVDLGSFASAINEHDLSRTLALSITTDSNRRGRPRKARTRHPFSGTEMKWSFSFALPGISQEVDAVEQLKSLQIATPDLSFTVTPETSSASSDEPDYFAKSTDELRDIVTFWAALDRESPRGSRRTEEPEELPAETVRWMCTWLRRTPLTRIGPVFYWAPSELRAGRPGRPVGGSLDSPKRRFLQRFVMDWQWWMSSLPSLLSLHLEDIRYVGPLRQAPSRLSSHSEYFSGTANSQMDSTGARVVNVLAEDPNILEQLNTAMSVLEMPYEADIKHIRQGQAELGLPPLNLLFLRGKGNGLELTLADVGVGVSQVLPVLLELVSAKKNLILLEQPELHLHPRLQSRLADVIADSILQNQNRVVIETHSEHILLRLQRRIREGNVQADDISLFYVDGKRGGSTVTRLSLTGEGNLVDPWPTGFFDDSIDDLLS